MLHKHIEVCMMMNEGVLDESSENTIFERFH